MGNRKRENIDALHEEVYEAIDGKGFNENSLKDLLKQKQFNGTFKQYILSLVVWAARSGKHERIKKFAGNFIYGYFDDDKMLFYTSIACLMEGMTDLGLNALSRYVPMKWLNNVFIESQCSDPILIIGATGTSKQLMAKAIHSMSNKRMKPCVEINCSAIPETMLESELFGYKKGAFTGAIVDKKGKFELAGEGTIFLDELGKMPKRLQAKILKVLDDKKMSRLGSEEKSISINARFIAAAQPDDLTNGIIPDLLYRLGYPDYIEMPTLKERIQVNARWIIENSLVKVKQRLLVDSDIKINDAAVSLIKNHDFEGNYRELESILKKGVKSMLINDRNEIIPTDIIDTLKGLKKNYPPALSVPMRNQYEYDLKSVKLKEIIDYADSIKKSIIVNKILEVKRSGKDIKSVLSEEGIPDTKYNNFYKKVKNITGKRLKDFT